MNIRSAANLAVAACTLGAAAQDTELVLRAQKGARSVVAVEFTSPPGLDPAWSKAGFGPVLLQDLRQSGVFQVKESTGPSPSSVPSSDPEPRPAAKNQAGQHCSPDLFRGRGRLGPTCPPASLFQAVLRRGTILATHGPPHRR